MAQPAIAAASPLFLAPGTRVRCSYRGSHVGIALATDDPRAWIACVAFPQSTPDNPPAQESVTAHVTRCHAQGILRDKQPVLWPWGIMWDSELSAVPADWGGGWHASASLHVDGEMMDSADYSGDY